MAEPVLSIQSTVAPRGSHVRVPRLGFGVYQILGDSCTTACQRALEVGYRQIDTAQLYRNEEQVGAALRKSGLPRSHVFITTKQGLRGDTPEATYQLAEKSVERIAGPSSGTKAYVDLFLIHIPHIRGDAEGRKEVWQALERLYAEGKARLIGVSNFSVDHMEEMKSYAKVWPPHVNQIELHPWSQQRDVVEYCERHGIAFQAYSPLAEGLKMDDEVLLSVARKHAKSPAQILVRYGLQRGWVVLPKSQRDERIQENASVFDFELDVDDMLTLDNLDKS
ncbi:NADP-dependent oxidoreductase domain-containing protein [Rhypophila decipiens]|uniref:NADP-dependent oxidoreductase domain-containing protein n=1 Tax=Rhypophila decipiens TaxID=261697 RepID=A0AAN6YQ68_9PEZI|nr:NADP-dependent oxidoreductase domain-containing protein [Rhypophila decipiens]